MLLVPAVLALQPALPPPPPPLSAKPAAPALAVPRPGSDWSRQNSRTASGQIVSINGLRQQARWLVEGPELWLPLEVLEGQLGVSRSQGPQRELQLDWYGQRLRLPSTRQRSLDDEVAVPVIGLLEPLGVQIQWRGPVLELQLPAANLLAIRSRQQSSGSNRVVLDLSGPVLVRSGEGRLQIASRINASQRAQLTALGLAPTEREGWLELKAEGQRLTLAEPWRVVLDLPATAATAEPSEPSGEMGPGPIADPRLLALQSQGLKLQRQVLRSAGQQLLVNSVQLEPGRVPLELQPLNRPDGMQGLSSLSQLARQDNALIAINGGYFNRVNRLPLGALREQGRWLSGPILNRGAVGWNPAELPSFDRLSLEESVEDSRGMRWPIASVNSGYVQKGLSRYTADWGSRYQPITGTEMAVLLRQGQVVARYESDAFQTGAPLAPGDQLLVARGGFTVPWQPGESITLRSRPTSPVGLKRFVLGGGPLLLQNGRIVLNGAGEGFSAGFMAQGAPRTVVGSDGRSLWLLTLQGIHGAGPTLLETALVLQQLGLRDALNLDGGSSTGLVLADVQTVKGRGVAAAVHNGLGLVPRSSAGQRELTAGR